MPITLTVYAVMSVVGIVSFIVSIIMLIKQFKYGGVLHGLIGLITCSLWTFIWGWMKHKSFQMTKIMVLWTILMGINILAPVTAFVFLGPLMLNEMMTTFTSVMEDGGFDKVMAEAQQKGVKKASDKKSKKTPATAKKTKKSSRKQAAQGYGDWSHQAVALWQDGKYTKPKKALDYWNRAISANSKSPEAYNNRGLAFYNLKRYQDAVKDYSQAIRLNPEDAIAYNNRGNAYYEMMKYEPAESDYNDSIAINPQYANAYLNRGLVHYQMDKNDQACMDFKKACDLQECEGIEWAAENGVCKGS
jgi:Tfp pilus assembly protein PilF